jgi:hypothetical protein
MWKGGRALDPGLLGEFASGRVYVEIVGGDGQAEIRGQVEPNGAMVPVKNYVAHLTPASGTPAMGAGTAVLSEIHFAHGRVSVFYQITVAGTSGQLRTAALVGVAKTAEPDVRTFLLNRRSRRLQLLSPRIVPTGGTITGQYEVKRAQRAVFFPTKLLSTGSREVGVVVNTSRFPTGELYGVFKPVP